MDWFGITPKFLFLECMVKTIFGDSLSEDLLLFGITYSQDPNKTKITNNQEINEVKHRLKKWSHWLKVLHNFHNI